MIGVNFQPGSGSGGYGNRPQGGNNNVQEAIKVLSLRLPRVVGAQAVSPQALLSSQGSGGNPRVDGVVNQVLQRMFPTPGGHPETAQSVPSFGMAPPQSSYDSGPQPQNAPTFSGSYMGGLRQEGPSIDNVFSLNRKPPQIIVDNPVMPYGDFSIGEDGRPFGGGGNLFGAPPSLDGNGAQPPASIAPLPVFPSYGGGGQQERPYEF
jgi:hypothetical protein